MDKTNVVSVEKIWFTNRDAQAYLGVSIDFLKRLRADGKLSFYKVGGMVFYRKRDIDKLLERGRIT